MKKWFYLSIAYFSWLILPCQAQMIDGQDTLYGPEWINYDQTYYKIKVAADGIYRLSYQTLVAAGFPVNQITAAELQLFCLGQEQPLYTTTDGILSAEDYLEFYGRQNRAELDRFLFRDAVNDMLNPDYSLITDTAVYFLTSRPGNHLRYQTITGSPGAPDTLEWYWHEEKVVFSEAHFKPTVNDDGVRLSDYVAGEGFGTTPFQDRTISFLAQEYVPNLYPPRLSFRLSGRNKVHEFTITHNQAQRFIKSAPAQMAIEDLELSQVFAENNFQFNSTVTNDRLVLGSITLAYPRRAIFNKVNHFHLSLPDFYPRSTLSITAPAGDSLLVYDKDARQRQVLTDQSGKFYLNLQDAKSQLILTQNIISVPQIEKIVFHKLDHSGINYVFITSTKFQPEVQAYSQYRQSERGGSYRTQVVFVEDLYDQYAYGQPLHPLSIKNWANHTAQNHQIDFALLIGKGFHYPDVRKKTAKGFLPVFGLPGSQQLLVSSGYSTIPHFAHGLLSATEGADINNYLTKVQDLEQILKSAPQTIEDRAWMKRVLHMAAGNDAIETDLLLSFLNNMGDKLSKNQFGANITSYAKQANSEIVDRGINENIFDLINSGVAIKTYFGHGNSSITLLDSYEHPGIFSNYQKYPIMLSLGCFTGNAFLSGQSLSEENILYPQKGAVGYIATSGQGYISTLSGFGETFYSSIGQQLFAQPLGQAIKDYLVRNEKINTVPIQVFKQQLIYQGDPAYKLNYSTVPDLIIDPTSISTNQSENPNTIALNFKVNNLGANVLDSVLIVIKHHYPQSKISREEKLNIRVPSDNVLITVNLNTNGEQGQHMLDLVVNPDNILAEGPLPAAKNNNTYSGYSFFVFDNQVTPSYPTEFAIVNTLPLELVATTGNAFAAAQDYEFELDTTTQFLTPLMTYKSQESLNPITWNITNLPMEDRVYYWRIKPTSADETFWKVSSFLYDPHLPAGWNQSHRYQWERNKLEGLYFDEDDLKYEPQSTHVFIRNKINYVHDRSIVNINGTPWFEAHDNRNFPSLALTIFDLNGQILKNKVGEHLNQYSRPITTHYFHTHNREKRVECIDFINRLPSGFTIILYPIMDNVNNNFNANDWSNDSIIYGENLFSFLEKQGAQLIRTAPVNNQLKPYILIFKKNIGLIAEKIGNSLDDVIVQDYLIETGGEQGVLITPLIGPSSSWQKISWADIKLDTSTESHLLVFGVNTENEAKELIRIKVNDFLLDTFNLSEYPYIRLEYSSMDKRRLSPPKLKYLRVLYEKNDPDLVISASEHFYFFKSKLQRGDSLKIGFDVINLSVPVKDSIDISFKVVDESNREFVFWKKIPPLKTKEKVAVDFVISTLNISGMCQLVINVNPQKLFNESSYLNNLGQINFVVFEDMTTPLIDVTFDNKHLKYLEVVSSKPEINILLIDENELYPFTTKNFTLELIDPDGLVRLINIDEEKFHFNETRLFNSGHKANLKWYPHFLKGGEYSLTISCRNNSGNEVGEIRAVYKFIVKIKEHLSIIAFPNPFTGAVKIVNNLLEMDANIIDFKIYNAQGMLIRSLTKSELWSPIKSPNTVLWWYGENDYGIKIPPGVYIYKLTYSLPDAKVLYNSGKIIFSGSGG